MNLLLFVLKVTLAYNILSYYKSYSRRQLHLIRNKAHLTSYIITKFLAGDRNLGVRPFHNML